MLKRKQQPAPPPITLDVYNRDGAVVSKKELPGDIFNLPISQELVHFAVTVQQANARAGTSATKTRGEVRGGGKKPWRQKGTGRARHGSIRSPIWRGGGVVFGPRTARNWTLRINTKVKKKALRMALSDKAQNGLLIVLDDFSFETPKTKEAAVLLSRLPLAKTAAQKNARVGVVVPVRLLGLSRALRNISGVSIFSPNSLNVVDLLKCRTLVAPILSIEEIISVLGEKKE